MKPPSKPFFVEVRRSRSTPVQASPPPRPSSSWEDTPEPAGSRSRAWQHAEQFFQPRPASPAPETERPEPAPVEPVPVPAQAVVERRGEADASSQAKASGGEESKNVAKRSRKVAKTPALQPEETKTSSVKRVRKNKVLQEDSLSSQSQPSPPRPEEARTVPPKTISPPGSFLNGIAAEDEAEAGGRRPRSARVARSAAKPGERWTCRLRHVRRNRGSGRNG